jgi:hypothetical protein
MNPKLEVRRANNEPKCADCGWWGGKGLPNAIALCGAHNAMTLDLAVCTDWRDGDPVQEILPPESNK